MEIIEYQPEYRPDFINFNTAWVPSPAKADRISSKRISIILNQLLRIE